MPQYTLSMTKLEQIQRAVTDLSDNEIWQFEIGFGELRNDRWDKQFDTDGKPGRLDKFAEKAWKEVRARQLREQQ